MSNIFQSLQQRFFGREVVRWLRPVIVLAVLAASALLGPRASTGLIILLVGVIAALIFMRWPVVAMLVMVVASFLVPFGIGTGTETSINITILLVILLLGLWIADMFINQRRVGLYPSRVIPPLIALCIVAILAFLAGQLPWFAFAGQVSLFAQLGGLMMFLLSAGAFLWVAHLSGDLKWLRWLVWLYLVIGAGFMYLHVIQLSSVARKVYVLPAMGAMTWLWVAALGSSQAIYNRDLKLRYRILLGAIAFSTFLSAWLNRGWFSGWVPAAVAVAVILLLRDWRLGAIFALLLGTGFLVINPDAVQSILSADQYSLFTRQEAWAIVLGNIVKVNPILGLGPSNYYNYTPLFPILGYNVQFNSHNQYVDLLAQTGILGLLAFLWLAFELGRLGWRLKDRAPRGFARAYVIGAIGGLAGTLVAGMLGDWVIPFIYNIGLAGFRSSVFAWMFLGGLVVIERLVNQAESQSA